MTTAASKAPSSPRVILLPVPTIPPSIPRANGARSAVADERVLDEFLACSRRVPILAPPPRKRFRVPPPPSTPPVAAQALLSGEPAPAAVHAAITISAVVEAGAFRVSGAVDDAREVL